MRLYDTLEECFEAVTSGKADYTYGQSYTTPYYLNIDNLNNLLYLPTSTKTVDICFGIVQPIDPDLLVIFNQSLRDLSGTDLDSIIYDNSLIDQSEQINSFISDHLLEFALGCISLLLIIIVLLMLVPALPHVRRTRRARRESAFPRAVPFGQRAVLRVFHQDGHLAHIKVEIGT